ncbi:MAG: DNA replication/repair protein RecF [Oleiphilus sp.]
MSIDKISLSNFRNIKNVSFSLHDKLNFISGANASGKTSLLESLYFISTGRSFRSRRIENIIKRDEKITEFILFALIRESTHHSELHKVGIKKSTVLPTQIKINQETVKTASTLAKLSPIILIEPLSFELINGAPKQRRQFLDWGVFHVEQKFSYDWNNYLNCLKQRNSLLRNAKIDDVLLNVWDKKIAEFGEIVHQQRIAYFESFAAHLKEYLSFFSINDNIKVSYYKGWEKNKNLFDVLKITQKKDIERKFTQAGPHRADIKVSVFSQSASENLSRGQQKLLVVSMYLAQIQTLYKEFGKQAVVLIDDIAAELDDKNLNLVFTKLRVLNSQIIVTVLNEGIIERISSEFNDYKMFHVEHGLVKTIE